MSCIKNIILDNYTVPANEVDGLKDGSITIRRRDESGVAAPSFSGELTFYGDAAKILRDKIINSTNPNTAFLDCTIFSSCKDDSGNPLELFRGRIKGGDISWCDDQNQVVRCDVKATVTEAGLVDEGITCLKNTIIWDRLQKADNTGLTDGEDQYRQGVAFQTCIGTSPRIMWGIQLLLGKYAQLISTLLAVVVFPIILVFNSIVTAVNLIPGVNIPKIDFDGNDDTNALNPIKELVNLIEAYTSFCGFKYKAPFIHSYLSNACAVCGLTLDSSLFQPGGPLHNLTRLDAAIEEGAVFDTNINAKYERNKPNLNAKQLLDGLAELNIKWWVDGTTLRVESKDFDTGQVVFDCSDSSGYGNLCFSILDEPPPAYGIYEYNRDPVDTIGNSVKSGWEDIIDWNAGNNPGLSGAKERSLTYTCARFRHDNQGEESLVIDQPFFKGIYPIAFGSSNHQNALVIDKGKSAFPKLLIWDGESPVNNALVQRIQVGERWDYNVPMWLRETYDGGVNKTLYELLFYTDNPNTTGVRVRNFSVQVPANCDNLKRLYIDGIVKNIPYAGGQKNGVVTEFNISSTTITIRGLV